MDLYGLHPLESGNAFSTVHLFGNLCIWSGKMDLMEGLRCSLPWGKWTAGKRSKQENKHLLTVECQANNRLEWFFLSNRCKLSHLFDYAYTWGPKGQIRIGTRFQGTVPGELKLCLLLTCLSFKNNKILFCCCLRTLWMFLCIWNIIKSMEPVLIAKTLYGRCTGMH